jgi:hypothetical protein
MKPFLGMCQGRTKRGNPCASVGLYKGYCQKHAKFEDIKAYEIERAKKSIARSEKKLAVFKEWVKCDSKL